MTEQQQAALRERVHSDPACAAAYAARDLDALTSILSQGRTRPTATEVGNGTILDVIGLASGTALLDAIHGQPAYKYVLPLLDQGRLKIGSKTAQDALGALVAGGALSQANAAKLAALGVEPAPFTRDQVNDALYNSDGTPK